MMKKKLWILLFAVSALIVVSCKNTPEDILTSHTWHGSTAEIYTDGKLVDSNAITSLKIILNDDKTFKVYNDDKLEDEGTWEYIEGEPAKLLFKGQTSVTLDISKLDKETLELSKEEKVKGISYKLVQKYKK